MVEIISWTTAVGVLLISIFVVFYLIYREYEAEKQQQRDKEIDQNIEWMGDQIRLVDKEYPDMIVTNLTDREKQIEKENRRIENARRRMGHCSTSDKND